MQVPEVKVTAQALLPSTSVISFTLGNGLSFTTFVNTVPINEHRTVNRFALIRCAPSSPPRTPAGLDDDLVTIAKRILLSDMSECCSLQSLLTSHHEV